MIISCPYYQWYYGNAFKGNNLLLNDLCDGQKNGLFTGALALLIPKIKTKLDDHAFMHATMRLYFPDLVRDHSINQSINQSNAPCRLFR